MFSVPWNRSKSSNSVGSFSTMPLFLIVISGISIPILSRILSHTSLCVGVSLFRGSELPDSHNILVLLTESILIVPKSVLIGSLGILFCCMDTDALQ